MTEVENYTDDFFYDGDERTIGKNDYCNFMIEGSDFFPCKKVSKSLPNGYYTIRKDYTRGISFINSPSFNIFFFRIPKSFNIF